MKTWLKFFIFIIVINKISFAQNLVPNYSFEDTISCPIQSDGTYPAIPFSCQNWYNPTNSSPDYLNACAQHIPLGNRGVPNNYPYLGWQYARTGNAYVCLGMLNSREIIQTQLISPLISQHTYCVEFYLSLPDSSHTACKNLGLFFSNTSIYFPNSSMYIGLLPQVHDTTIVTDTANWVKISGQFIANGGEEYITMGNFYPLSSSDTIMLAQPYNGAGYFIDDVSVIDCTGITEGVKETEDENGLVVYPNPSEGMFEVKSTKAKIKSVAVYNVLGELIGNRQKVTGNNVSVDLTGYTNGIYFVEVRTEKGVMRKKFVKE